MTINNIVEICVGINVAILGIAYPIIVDKISNIGEKFSSHYLSDIFNDEFPHRIVRLPKLFLGKELTIFSLCLYINILAFIFLIFEFEPLFGRDYWIINNSANLLVFILTLTLVSLFFIWLNKVILYNGKATSLLTHVINNYNSRKNTDKDHSYYLKTINELTYYAVKQQDTHLQKTLLEFYYSEFATIRKNHDKAQPLVYPSDLYQFINSLSLKLIKSDNDELLAIAHRAVSGAWLLGQDFEEIEISEVTYSWLWSNFAIISENERFVKMYWGTSSQYFEYKLKAKQQEYDYGSGIVKNADLVTQRNNERKAFLEFHYALGGLLLYKKQYGSIKYILTYSQSFPPKYVLLPSTMTEVFEWFEEFRNEFKRNSIPIDAKYFFPELDNLGNSSQVIYWISSYITLLFIRQYSLRKYYSFQDFTSLPRLPENVVELNNWLDGLAFFEKCLKDITNNKELTTQLGYEGLISEKHDDYFLFINKLRAEIEHKIGSQKLYAPLSLEKISQFEISTNKIISEAFNDFKSIFITVDKDSKENYLIHHINGGKTLMSKSAFTDGDIPHLNYDSVIASQISTQVIKRNIPISFSTVKTKRYLLNRSNIEDALKIVVSDNPNLVIVGIGLNYDTIEAIERFSPQVLQVPSADYGTRNVLFVLDRDDLPSIEHADLGQDEINEFKLKLINKDLKLYSSIVDINQPENQNLKSELSSTSTTDDIELQVLVSVAFIANIYWKKERKIIQINIASQYEEQGIQNDLKDVVPYA